jgi:hypothetical protein
MARTALPKTGVSTVVSLKATLRDTKPPIWRRILMADTMTLADLHKAIQGAMGWHDAHLHLFDINGRQYGDPRTVDDVADERRLTLRGLLKSGVLRFAYIYDFGDSWEHVIATEKTRPALDGETLPSCVAGKRACPPEDCGGTRGYDHLLKVLADPSHPEYQQQLEWIDEEIDPEAFDIDLANTVLKAKFNRK